MSAGVFIVDREERIDRLARDLYGSEQGGTVEALLGANICLAEACSPNGYVPAGTRLIVPETVVRSTATSTRPWD